VRVAVCSRDRERIEAAAQQLGEGAVPLVADVGSAEGAETFVEEATRALGALYIVIPNAGGPPAGTFASTPVSAYQGAFELNLVSTVAMCKAAVPAMQARGWGRVVAITSISVRQPIPTLILSNTARAGVTGFLKTLAREVAGDGVTVNSVQPGFHLTGRLASLRGDDIEQLAASVPAGRIGSPDAFGGIVAFLCSEHANYITGAALPVDGGSYAGLQ
jgi:3-oxoacyl-[acyl-carrier protein] reductase